jgi:hypothetical protein
MTSDDPEAQKKVRPVPVQMWQGWEPNPGADVAGWASPGADVGRGVPFRSGRPDAGRSRGRCGQDSSIPRDLFIPLTIPRVLIMLLTLLMSRAPIAPARG